MLNLKPEDFLHKSFLNRLLIEIIDNPLLSFNLAFKGGTCAEMLGFLDRFSVDLDFDIIKIIDQNQIHQEFLKIFTHLEFLPVKKSKSSLFYQLKYPNETGKRNTMKISASSLLIKANDYKIQYFPEIDRLANSQAIETMFANKLVAVTNRYQTHQTIAGRDIYDLHHFFIQGYRFKKEVIMERTGLNTKDYLIKLRKFIKNKITQIQINEDLNLLLPPSKFQQIRKILLPETISLLTREIEK